MVMTMPESWEQEALKFKGEEDVFAMPCHICGESIEDCLKNGTGREHEILELQWYANANYKVIEGYLSHRLA